MRLSALALALSLVSVSTATLPTAVLAQASADPLNVLIDQGKYWQTHHRGDLAEQAWQKVLRIDPKQPDALFGMGMVLADRKDGSGAQQYLARLREVAPNYPNIDELGPAPRRKQSARPDRQRRAAPAAKRPERERRAAVSARARRQACHARTAA